MDGVTLFLLRQVGGWRENRFSMKSLVLFRNEVGDLITVLNLADLVWKERPSTPLPVGSGSIPVPGGALRDVPAEPRLEALGSLFR